MARVTRREIHPVGDMVLICHDDDKEVTSGGIILPDNAKVFTLTGRIVRIPDRMKEDHLEYPFEELDRVIYDTRDSIPCDLETGNKLFLVEAKKIYGIVRDVENE